MDWGKSNQSSQDNSADTEQATRGERINLHVIFTWSQAFVKQLKFGDLKKSAS